MAEAQSDLKRSSLKSPQNIRKTQDFLSYKDWSLLTVAVAFHTETCLSQVISVCCCSHTLHCRVLNLMYLKEEKGSQGLQSRSVHTLLPSLSLSFCFSLSSVLYRKAFQENSSPNKRRYYFYLTPFLFQCGLKLQVCLFESSSRFLWIVLHSLVFLLAFVFFLYRVSRSIKAIRSPNSAR